MTSAAVSAFVSRPTPFPAEFAAIVGAPAIQVAMDEEAAPFLPDAVHPAAEGITALAEPIDVGRARFYALQTAGGNPFVLVRAGIGLVNAAAAATLALAVLKASAIVSAGSAGGLRQDVNVGDVAVGRDFTFTDADGTAFGYVRGQVPGMPESYPGAEALIARAQTTPIPQVADEVEGASVAAGQLLVGQMLAGGSFVTAHNVGDARQAFPSALSTDMETTAIAQVAWSIGVPMTAVRGISDLCGPAADQDFHLSLDVVAVRSAAVALGALGL